jgi:hypothetical protein
MPDGKPDLSGMWYQQRIVDRGKPEMTVSATAADNARSITDMPQSHCQPMGFMIGPQLLAWKTVQTPALLVEIIEGELPRQIFLDGRGHPKDLNPTWMVTLSGIGTATRWWWNYRFQQ